MTSHIDQVGPSDRSAWDMRIRREDGHLTPQIRLRSVPRCNANVVVAEIREGQCSIVFQELIGLPSGCVPDTVSEAWSMGPWGPLILDVGVSAEPPIQIQMSAN